MLHRTSSLVVLPTALFLAACQGPARSDSGGAPDAATIALDEGYALLYSTISQECDVDKVLIIKDPAPPVADLIKTIGQFSRDAKANLESLAKEEPAIDLDDQGLPDVEAETRDAISSTTSGQILFDGGKDLEFRLLLTQLQALNYITHLAASIADREPSENRERFLGQLSRQSEVLREQVLSQLMAPYIGQAD